ncbi:MAG: DUF4114 domain-containing protein [Syntrophus sp. (in: bacteria)]
MKSNLIRIWAVLTLAMAVAAPIAWAQGTVSAIQSTARPMGLDIVGPVMVAGSDAAAADFQKNSLPSINQLLGGTLSETTRLNDTSFALDPQKLSLKTASDVRVYFVGEGAGYSNTLGFSVSADGKPVGNSKLILPDTSSTVSFYDPKSTVKRTTSAPLLPGDYVNLGTFNTGSTLDFFLVANGAAGGNNVFSTVTATNPDRINHVVAFAVPNSPYLVIGFEDMYGGGDRDFNDVLFAVDIGAQNVAALSGAPEPALLVVLGVFVPMALWMRRRFAASPHDRQVA